MSTSGEAAITPCQRGVSLIELMVALAIGLFLMLGAVMVYSQSRKRIARSNPSPESRKPHVTPWTSWNRRAHGELLGSHKPPRADRKQRGS